MLGILIANLGTPDEPTPEALRRYLGEFLWDPRVVEGSRPLWWLALNGVVLRTRPRKSAEAYSKVWTEQGSPLLAISLRQLDALRTALNQRLGAPVEMRLGMRYGKPSIAQGLQELLDAGVQRLLVLPLYPQYSATTTASVFDAVAAIFSKARDIPALRFVRDYHADNGYIEALAASVREHWQARGQGERLVLSFHGIPKEYADRGDPYPQECHATAARLAAALDLPAERWNVTFQSRFGPREWLQPYTDKTLEALARDGIRHIDLACPGFSADCLETLEENAMTNRELFFAAGGERFEYIPCLNDRADHIQALTDLIARELGGWL